MIFTARGEPGNEANCTNNVDNRLAMRNNKILWLSELKVSRELTVIRTFCSHVSNHLSPPVYCCKLPVNSDTTPFPQNYLKLCWGNNRSSHTTKR